MNTNFQITIQTFKSLHDPIQPLQRSCLFTKLFKSKDNKIIKRKVFETKKEFQIWKKCITYELLNQRILSSKYPGKVLTILNFTVEELNHQRNLYITYDCEDEIEPLFQYLNNNPVSFQEQVQIFEQLLQITCILFKSQFEHTNLKPNNILYYKKQVLITDFGSARTHQQNFLKEYTAQAEKEWQNNLIFFYPQEYQKIMEEDNSYIRIGLWNDFDISDQKFRKYIDIWALSMMMIQVFENNQKLPNKLNEYYGLNEKLLFKKIENLKQYSNGIISETIYSLLIEKKDPEQVYQTFLQKKKLIHTEQSSQMESTFNIKQIFDHVIDDDNVYPSYKPENYFLANQAIKDLQNQFDDASSVISSNYQIDIISFNEIKQKNNLIPIQNQQLPQSINQLSPTKIKPQTQQYDFSQNHPQFFNIQDNTSNQNNNQNQKKPSIVITNYDFNRQQIQGVKIQDTQIKNFSQVLSPNQSQIQIVNRTNYPNNLKQIQDDDQEIEQTTKDKTDNNLQLGCLQSIQLDKIDDNEQGDAHWSPIFNQNGIQTFQFLEVQKLNNVNQNDNNVKDIVSFKDSQNFQLFNQQNQDLLNLEDEQQLQGQLIQFQGEKDNQNQVQQLKIITINDFDDNNQQIPQQNQVQKEIIQSNLQVVKLSEIDNEQNDTQTQKKRDPQQTNQLIIIPTIEKMILQTDDAIQDNGGVQSKVIKNNININQSQFQQLQPFDDQNYGEIKNEDDSVIMGKNLEENDYSLLIDFSENDKEQFQDKNKSKSKNKSLIQFVNDDKPFQQIQQFEDPEEILEQESISTPVPLKVIKNILNEGVIQLQDKDQKEILEQLKILQKIFTQQENNFINPTNIFEKEQDKKTQKQIKSFFDEILSQDENQQIQLIEDVNDGIGFILKKQETDKIFDDNKIEKNPLLLTYLNQDQLKLLKQNIQGNKVLTDQIEKLIEVKDDFKKFKQNPNQQNLLKMQQIDLLNKEELKIYLHLLETLPKDKKQGKQLIGQQLTVERKLKEIKQQEEEELKKQKLIDFLLNPSFDNLLPNSSLKKLNNQEKQKYKAALKDLFLKSSQRQKKLIQEQIDFINKIKKKNDINKPQINKIDEASYEGSTKQSSKFKNHQNFQDAYKQAIDQQLGDNNDNNTILLSFNKYIREFQQSAITYLITDLIPDDCQNYQQQQSKNRKVKFYDFQDSKYKGETFNDYPDGIGIMRKNGVSSIYQGYFKQGKFYWGQVLEMNDSGLLTQYVGYYNQEYQVKHGKARLKWYKPQKMGFCGGYQFIDYEIYEGDFILGYIHGKGKKIYADQSEYEGEWKKNKRVGLGRLILKQGGKNYITYEGQFQDDVQHGKKIKAIHHHQTGLDLIVEGEYKKGKPIGQHLLIFNEVVQREIIY